MFEINELIFIINELMFKIFGVFSKLVLPIMGNSINTKSKRFGIKIINTKTKSQPISEKNYLYRIYLIADTLASYQNQYLLHTIPSS